jgi:hypothetical protein
MPEGTVNVILTRAQRMALVDILCYYIRDRNHPQEFIGYKEGETDTGVTTGEILQIVSQAS